MKKIEKLMFNAEKNDIGWWIQGGREICFMLPLCMEDEEIELVLSGMIDAYISGADSGRAQSIKAIQSLAVYE